MSISPNAVLTINSSQIDSDSPAVDGYDGHVTVADSAALIVNTSGPWRLDGTMTLQGQQVTTPNVIIDGSDFVNHGTIKAMAEFKQAWKTMAR